MFFSLVNKFLMLQDMLKIYAREFCLLNLQSGMEMQENTDVHSSEI
jgi:hypothetical protein